MTVNIEEYGQTSGQVTVDIEGVLKVDEEGESKMLGGMGDAKANARCAHSHGSSYTLSYRQFPVSVLAFLLVLSTFTAPINSSAILSPWSRALTEDGPSSCRSTCS